MSQFKQLDIAYCDEAKSLAARLQQHPEYFGKYDNRTKTKESPHRESTDIWVRFKDIRENLITGDFTNVCDEHASMWYPIAAQMPEVATIAGSLMRHVDGNELGGILITKLAPKAMIYPHTDKGWHAGHYKKYYIPILNKFGAAFNFVDGSIKPAEGDVWEFDNSRPHWVVNDSNTDRISLIICIRSGDEAEL